MDFKETPSDNKLSLVKNKKKKKLELLYIHIQYDKFNQICIIYLIKISSLCNTHI